MRISDWSSDVCSSDLIGHALEKSNSSSTLQRAKSRLGSLAAHVRNDSFPGQRQFPVASEHMKGKPTSFDIAYQAGVSQSTVSRALRNSPLVSVETRKRIQDIRSEEHTSALQSLMRISYA